MQHSCSPLRAAHCHLFFCTKPSKTANTCCQRGSSSRSFCCSRWMTWWPFGFQSIVDFIYLFFNRCSDHNFRVAAKGMHFHFTFLVERALVSSKKCWEQHENGGCVKTNDVQRKKKYPQFCVLSVMLLMKWVYSVCLASQLRDTCLLCSVSRSHLCLCVV